MKWATTLTKAWRKNNIACISLRHNVAAYLTIVHFLNSPILSKWNKTRNSYMRLMWLWEGNVCLNIAYKKFYIQCAFTLSKFSKISFALIFSSMHICLFGNIHQKVTENWGSIYRSYIPLWPTVFIISISRKTTHSLCSVLVSGLVSFHGTGNKTARLYSVLHITLSALSNWCTRS